MFKIRSGLDVHADIISVAVAGPHSGKVRSLGVIANQPEQIRELIQKLAPAENLRACYEAGPTKYGLYWQLIAVGLGAAQGSDIVCC